MPDTENLQQQLTALEAALVSEFRAYQTLVALTQDERQALLANNVQALQDLLNQKETLLGNLERLESARLAALESWACAANVEAHTLTDVLANLELTAGERLQRLRDGILALTAQLRELSHGNRALANSALEGVEAVHNFLLSLSQTPTGYQRPGASQNTLLSTALAVEQLV
jgi:flagellar biosynthesis/type III secretory pathway chaperone